MHTVVSHVLDPPIIARFVRIHPESWSSKIALRAEFFGCREGEFHRNISSESAPFSFACIKALQLMTWS